MSEDGDEGKAWLDELESTVKQAAETIETLRRERDELTARVGELEAELESTGEPGKAEEAAEAWREERREIRRRVQKLTERLEGILDE